MKPHQFVLMIVVFIGLLGYLGGVILGGANEYGLTPSDNFTEMLTGGNYSEYKDKVEQLQISAEDDGFLAQFKLGKSVLNIVTSSFGQVTALITNIATYLQIPYELTALVIVVIIIASIFGGIYLIIS